MVPVHLDFVSVYSKHLQKQRNLIKTVFHTLPFFSSLLINRFLFTFFKAALTFHDVEIHNFFNQFTFDGHHTCFHLQEWREFAEHNKKSQSKQIPYPSLSILQDQNTAYHVFLR